MQKQRNPFNLWAGHVLTRKGQRLKIEQRQLKRLGCTGEATVSLSPNTPPVLAIIRDLTIEGCLVELREDESAQTSKYWAEAAMRAATMELTFHVNRLPFRIRAKLRRVEANNMAGFSFTQVSNRTKGNLNELIDELNADRNKRKARTAHPSNNK